VADVSPQFAAICRISVHGDVEVSAAARCNNAASLPDHVYDLDEKALEEH